MKRALAIAGFFVAACGAKSGLERPPPPDADLDALVAPDAALDVGHDAPIPDGCRPSDETCDGRDEDCDGVPDDGLVCWTIDGEAIAPVVSTLCATAFYAYDTPARASANPPVDVLRTNRAEIVLVETSRSCGGGAIAVIADQIEDGDGGSLRLRFALDHDDGGVVVGDEPDECAYDRGALRGACVWGWQPCCTDGVMLGPFPSDQCVELTLDGHDGAAPVGIDTLVVIDGDGEPRPLAFGVPHRVCRTAR